MAGNTLHSPAPVVTSVSNNRRQWLLAQAQQLSARWILRASLPAVLMGAVTPPSRISEMLRGDAAAICTELNDATDLEWRTIVKPKAIRFTEHFLTVHAADFPDVIARYSRLSL